MGYKVTFDSGEVVSFEQEPNQQDIEEAYQQISANRKPNIKAPELNDEWSDTFEKNLLSPLLGMSRAFGGASPEAHRASVLEASESAKQNPTAAFAGKAGAALGPLISGAGPLGLVNPISGGVGLTSLGQMGAGVVGGAMAAPIVGPQMGMETYEQQKIMGTPEDEARTAGITSGVINAAANMVPLPGSSLLGRFAKGAGLNVGADILDKSLQNLQISEPKNRPDILDPVSMAVNAAVGGISEGLGGNRVGDRMIDPKPKPQSTRIKETLQEANTSYVKAKILEIETKEKELEKSIIEGTATPDILKEAEYLYQTKLKLQRSIGIEPEGPREVYEELVREQKDLERQLKAIKYKINTGDVTEDLIAQYDDLSVKLAENKKNITSSSYKPKHDDTLYESSPWDVANSKIAQAKGNPIKAAEFREDAKVKLFLLDKNDPKNSSLIEALEHEIKAYEEQLGIAPKPTERPLEAPKIEEPIPSPTPTKETLSTKEIDDLMAGFTKERNTITDSAGVMYKWDDEPQVPEPSKAFLDNEPPERANTFRTREELNDYLTSQINIRKAQIQRVQDLLNFAKENNVTEVQLKNKVVSVEDLKSTRDFLNKKLEDLGKAGNKSSLVIEDTFVTEVDDQGQVHISYDINGNPIILDKPVPENKPLYTKDSILKSLDYKIKMYSGILEKLRQNIFDYDNGVFPSGGTVFTFKDKDYGIDAAKGLEEQLTATYQRYIENRNKVAQTNASIKQARRAPQNVNDLPEINPDLIPESVAQTPKVKATSVDDIFNSSSTVVQDFIDNPQLFKHQPNTDVHVDSRLIVEYPDFEKTINSYLKDTGLYKDKIYIIQGEETGVHFSGNSSVIVLNTKDLARASEFYKNHPRLKNLLKDTDQKTFSNFALAINLGHELGHVIFTKWLQSGKVTGDEFTKIINEFEVWKKKNNIEPFSVINSQRPDVYQNYHSVFDEYFSERVSEALLKDTLLTTFSDKRFKIVKQLNALINNMVKSLRTMGLKLTGDHFKADLVNDILSRNREEIQKTGRTIWELWETEKNDKLILSNPKMFPFNKTLDDIRDNPYTVYRDVPGLLESQEIPWIRKMGDANALPNIANLSSRALDAIGNGGRYLARKLFGKTTLAGIFRDNPKLQNAHTTIRNAEYSASTVANDLWFGDVTRPDWDSASVWQKFSKVKKPDSPYMIHKELTNEESFNIHAVFKQGFDNNLDYPQTLATFGQHLSAKEKQAFNVFADMFKKQFNHIIRLERMLTKKNIISYRTGWYPGVREGDFFSTVNVNGNTIHRQHFATKVAAEAWVKEMEGNLPNNTFSVGPIENVKDSPQHPGIYEIIDIYDNYVLNKYNVDLSQYSDEVKNKLATRGGVFGKHHLHRENLSGYKGSEIGKTQEELGHSFKEALNINLQEFQASYRNMIIKHRIDPVLNVGDLKQTEPQTWAAINQMKESSMNITPNSVEAFDKAVFETTDRIARSIYEALYPQDLFTPRQAVYKTIQDNLIGAFYLIKVLPSLGMFVTQLLSPLQALRHAAYDGGGLSTLGNFGKGLYKLVTKDSDLMDALYQATQTSDTIEPQFIKTLHLQGENKVLEWMKDWVAMRKPQEAADILSRVMTFSFLYEHYKSINPYDALRKALEGVDATMGAYSRGETAPVFKNLGGIIGEGMRPLQTYGQMTVGNIVADIKHMVNNPTKLSAYAPFIMAGLVTTLMGGAVSGVIMTQYETTRKLLMNINPQWELPSILDLIIKGTVSLDSIIEDPEALTKLTAYGVLSSSTGIDIGASTRTTETLPGNVLTVLLALVEGDNASYDAVKAVSRIFPVHSNALQMTHGAGVLGKKALGGNITDSELKQAITDVSMRGPMKNALMEMTGANKTTVMGNKTDMIATGAENKALMEEGSKEKTAHWLGNLSTEERFRTDLNLQNTFKERAINNRIKRLYTLYNENPKPKYLDELIELGATDKNIKSQLETRSFNALVDQYISFITNSKVF